MRLNPLVFFMQFVLLRPKSFSGPVVSADSVAAPILAPSSSNAVPHLHLVVIAASAPTSSTSTEPAAIKPKTDQRPTSGHGSSVKDMRLNPLLFFMQFVLLRPKSFSGPVVSADSVAAPILAPSSSNAVPHLHLVVIAASAPTSSTSTEPAAIKPKTDQRPTSGHGSSVKDMRLNPLLFFMQAFPMIEECTDEFLKIMEKDKAAQERGGIDISPAFCRLSLEILLRFTMGARLNVQAASEETEVILNAARNAARRFPLGWVTICNLIPTWDIIKKVMVFVQGCLREAPTVIFNKHLFELVRQRRAKGWVIGRHRLSLCDGLKATGTTSSTLVAAHRPNRFGGDVMNSDLDRVVTASVCTTQPARAEEVGIGLAIVSPPKADHATILFQSLAAIRRFREETSRQRQRHHGSARAPLLLSVATRALATAWDVYA
ncbi:putative cytochrome P450 [Ixodes scapularis]